MPNLPALICSMFSATGELHDIQGELARVHQAQADLSKVGTEMEKYFSQQKANIDQWAAANIHRLYSSTKYKALSNSQLNDTAACARYMQQQNEFAKKMQEIQMKANAAKARIEQEERARLEAIHNKEKYLEKRAHQLQLAADILQQIAKSAEEALAKGIPEAFGVKMAGYS